MHNTFILLSGSSFVWRLAGPAHLPDGCYDVQITDCTAIECTSGSIVSDSGRTLEIHASKKVKEGEAPCKEVVTYTLNYPEFGSVSVQPDGPPIASGPANLGCKAIGGHQYNATFAVGDDRSITMTAGGHTQKLTSKTCRTVPPSPSPYSRPPPYSGALTGISNQRVPVGAFVGIGVGALIVINLLVLIVYKRRRATVVKHRDRGPSWQHECSVPSLGDLGRL